MIVLLAAAAGFYVLVAGLVFVAQRSMLFPAPPPTVPRIPGAKVIAPAIDRPAMLYVDAPAGAPTLVHFHGNGQQLADLDGWVDLARSASIGLLAVEFPGYGLMANGAPSEDGLNAAAESALSHLRGTLGVTPDRTILSGQSLGTAVATEMARRGHGARLVLLSPFTSIRERAGELFPWLPTRLLVRDPLDSAAKAPRVPVPVLVFHGTEDEVVPYAMGERLSRLFPRAELVPLAGAGHNDLFELHGEELRRRIAAFATGEAP